MKISTNSSDVLITHALGSCLGLTVYDPVARVGGMLHAMLPLSTIDPRKAGDNPYMFVDTGVPRLFLESYKAGAQKNRLIVKAAGGATLRPNQEEDYFEIGRRNFIMLKKLLWKNDVLLNAHDVGGGSSRTMLLSLETGDVTLRVNGTEIRL
jgi:chemotaxis protein CheD